MNIFNFHTSLCLENVCAARRIDRMKNEILHENHFVNVQHTVLRQIQHVMIIIIQKMAADII